ncbi:MAG: SusC/RagA family TonB-linked outer membrane protein [Bacteroidales bacterium]|nr:SusC/RagA family TonB-linked outer membrane protein [Bacteroidales bacterium]
MKKRYINILIVLSLALLLFPVNTFAQKDQKDNYVKVESVVTDETGNPIQGATVYGNEGSIVAKTDASGKFSILIPPQTDIFIESAGHESRFFKQGEINNLKAFQLPTSEFMYGEKDDVNVAFRKVKRGDLVGAITVIEPDEISEYDNNQSVTSALAGRIPGMLGSSNIRGIGNALFVIDGLPRDASSLTMAEVEQITVLKDVNSSIMYGSKGVNGIVLITTKRGEAYKQSVKVNGYYGVSLPVELPKYLSSADYMELYNEARVNDGLSAPYDLATIEKYRTGNKYRYPDVDYYSSEYLKSYRPYFKATTELSGGNEVATYYSNIGWSQTGSLLNFGQGAKGAENVFNVRGNVDLNINKYVKSSIDAVAIFDNLNSQTGNFWSNASTYRPNLFSPLIPIDLVVPGNDLVSSRKTDVNGMYLLGGTSSYTTNGIAEGYAGGQLQTIRRTFSFNNRIDADLNDLVQGLTFHTNFGFDLYTKYDQTVDNSYSVYDPVWDADVDSIVSLTQYGTDTRSGSQAVGGSYFERRFSFYGGFNYDRTFNDVHHVFGSLVGYGNRFKAQGDEQGQKDFNFGLDLTYAFNKKYLVNFSGAYLNSVYLPKSEKMALSPSLGLAWVISSEDFMSSLNFIDYLKLRATGGIINSDAGIGGFFYYDNRYGTSSSYSWYEGTYSNSGVISNYGGNMSLSYERRKEFNFGFEGLFFNKMIGIDANVFTSQYYDQITRPSTIYPSFYSNFLPYANFDNNAYRGAELGLTFNKKIGAVNVAVGVNALYANSEVIKRDEVYANDYQYRTGHPTDARFALVADGLFENDEEIAAHAYQTFGTVKPGDIKYVDQNNDGIVNSDDQVIVGRSQSPYSFGLNLRLNYKSLTLFAQGYGRFGADTYMSNAYYWVDGDDKYSETVLNRWTPYTKETATYPRLSSISNSNNFQNSTYWLFRDDYFDLQRIQLTYELPESVAGMFYMKRLSCYVDASNVYMFSKYREVKDLNVGSEPQYRSFSLGIKTTF